MADDDPDDFLRIQLQGRAFSALVESLSVELAAEPAGSVVMESRLFHGRPGRLSTPALIVLGTISSR